MKQSGKLMPNLDEKTTKVLNLTVLQRIDPYVEEILLTAAHVTFYEFNIDTSQWARKGVEGSLFVVKRNDQPRFQFIVMNRRNMDNLVEDLLGDFEYDVQVPYLLYRNASQEVNGIWFYDAHECELVANLFRRILNAYAKVPSKSKESSTQSSELKEPEAVPTLPTIEGPLEPPLTADNLANVPEDSAFVNFFSTVMNLGVAPNIMQPHGLTASTIPPTQTQTGVSATVPAFPNQSTIPVPNPFSSILGGTQSNTETKLSADPVRPASLFSPPSSSPSLIMPVVSGSLPSAPQFTPLNLHRPYGTPLLQPFPPPTPLPPSLTPASITEPRYGSLRRDKVQQALQSLVQDDRFIDMVYRAMTNPHQ